jgi:hypothetical protein
MPRHFLRRLLKLLLRIFSFRIAFRCLLVRAVFALTVSLCFSWAWAVPVTDEGHIE